MIEPNNLLKEIPMEYEACANCIHCTENAHYGEGGDTYAGLCMLKDKPIDLNDFICDDYEDNE